MNHEIFIERMDMIDSLKEMPEKFLSEANIQYLAPADAGDTGLPDASVDYHISTTVFEHIPKKGIARILKEAKRILKEDGVAIHFIDLSDHFQHQDKSITSIIFLRYSDKEWEKIGVNQFAYCNRLRVSDYLKVFEDLGFTIDRHETLVDPESIRIVRDGKIALHSRFAPYTLEELCSTSLRVLLSQPPDKGKV